MNTKQHIPIFVSSTFDDMKLYREAVQDSLHRMEAIVKGMEYFGSKSGSPLVECLKVVQESKVYVGIFSMRYGSIDEESGKSMTHLELDEAEKLKLPILIYLIDEDNQPILPKYIDTGETAVKLLALKNYLKKNYLVSFFTTPDDLARRISQDLPPVLEKLGVELTNKINLKDDAAEILQKFKLRPKKYSGYESTIEGKISGKIEIPDYDVIRGFKMTLGNTIRRNIILDTFQEPFLIYAEDDLADILENINEDTLIKVTVKLMFGLETFSVTTDEGKIKREIPRMGLKLIKKLQ